MNGYLGFYSMPNQLFYLGLHFTRRFFYLYLFQTHKLYDHYGYQRMQKIFLTLIFLLQLYLYFLLAI